MRTTLSSSSSRGFTLVELLLSMSVLAILMVLMADVIVRTQNTMTQATAHVGEFQEARSALDAVSHSVSQAVLDGYWTYRRDASGHATAYERGSDHHFILGPAHTLVGSAAEAGQAVFFQAPLGFAGSFTDDEEAVPPVAGLERLHSLMNCWGFYVRFDTDIGDRPDFLRTAEAKTLNPERKRFRLMQYSQPAEDNKLYRRDFALNRKASKAEALTWFQDDLALRSRPVADNILALVLVPFSTNVTVTNSTAGYSDVKMEPDPAYSYDSREFQWGGGGVNAVSRRHQLPPQIQVTVIAAEEGAFDRFVNASGGDADAAAGKVREVLKDRFVAFEAYEDDVKEVEKGLSDLGLHHRFLTATITLRGGKWISEMAP